MMSNDPPQPSRRRRPGRPPSRRRRAHQALPDTPPGKIKFEHELAPQGSPIWVDQPDALAGAIDAINKAGVCCYDTEFIGEETYHANLCLVQLATADQVYVVDAHAGLDLMGIWRIIADPAVVKIVHAGEQDLEPVVRLLGEAPANVFDTQIAAGFAGLRYPCSLSRLIKCMLGVKPPKGLTFTQWDERPMSAGHLQYAADDVRFGLALHEALVKQLEKLGHVKFVEQACCEAYRPERFDFDVQQVYDRMRGAKGLEGRKRGVLRELIVWRDRAAREADLPPRTFCKDEVLMDLSRKPADSREQFEGCRFLSNYHKREYGDDIFAAMERGKNLPPDQRPAKGSGESSPQELFEIDKLWVAVMAYCYQRQVDPAVVTNRAQISKLYLSLDSKKQTELGNLTNGWRREFIGQWLSEYLTNNL